VLLAVAVTPPGPLITMQQRHRAAVAVIAAAMLAITHHCSATQLQRQQRRRRRHCEPVTFVGDSWSPALQPADCSTDCAPVRPFFWLKAPEGQPGGAPGMAAQALNYTRARAAPGRTVTLGSYSVHFGINTHPADALLAANQSSCADAPGQGYHGKHVTFSGLWWDHGVREVSTRFRDILGNYSAMGGLLDRVVLDTEIWLTAKVLFDKVPAACALLRSAAIEVREAVVMARRSRGCSASVSGLGPCARSLTTAVWQRDPRWPRLRATLHSRGLDFNAHNTSLPGYIYRAVRGDPDREPSAPARLWADMMQQRVAEYLNAAIWEPVQAAFPRSHHDPSQPVSLSNYGFVLHNHSRAAAAGGCVPDWFGGCSGGDSPIHGGSALNGNTQSQSLYYMRFWNPQFERGLHSLYPTVLSYPKTPFNAFRWSVLLLRAQVTAGIAPNALSFTEDVRVRPWVAYRAYSHGAVVNNSDYYQEALLHYLATGSDDINFWNPHEVADLGAEDNRVFGRTLLEASKVLGCAGRRWSFPRGNTPAGGDADGSARNTTAELLASPLLLSGMSHVGPDGAQTRFRLTTAHGAGAAPLRPFWRPF
jgi:hypothetical protein